MYFDTGKPPVAYVFESLPSEGPVLMKKADADRRIELAELSYADIEKEFGAMGFKKAPPAGWNSKKEPDFFNAETNRGVNWGAENFANPDVQKNAATGGTWDIKPPRADDL